MLSPRALPIEATMIARLNLQTRESLLMVGTTKGLFLFLLDVHQDRWVQFGPHFKGHSVYAATYDGRRGRQRIWAATSSPHWGSVLCSSDDLGGSWRVPGGANIKFPSETNEVLKQIWQVIPGRPDDPDTLYCGVEPAALFISRDAGETWSLVRGLYDHDHRPRWQPGGGGLCLHTIVLDPLNRKRMFVAVSTGGVYRTEDGGETWHTSHRGVRADFFPEGNRYPEFGQCVHKIVSHPVRPDRLYLQNHGGLYRTDDGGDSWQDIASDVPSDFGFAMEIDPHDPNTVYIVPLESDEFRCTVDAKLRVYRTRNAGESWEPLSKGLPQEKAYETVLRDGLAAGRSVPTSLFFGTRSGKLFGSRDGGESWELIAEGLPPVVCVKTALIDDHSQQPAPLVEVRLAEEELAVRVA